MNFRHILFFSVILSLNSPVFSQSASDGVSSVLSPERVSPQRQIIAGDKILISIRNVRQLSGGFNVDLEGFVDLQLIGKVKAEGFTPAEFEQTLSNLYGKDYLQDPFIRIEITSSFREDDILFSETVSSHDDFKEENSNLEAAEISANSETSFVPIEEFIEPEVNEAPLDITGDGQTLEIFEDNQNEFIAPDDSFIITEEADVTESLLIKDDVTQWEDNIADSEDNIVTDNVSGNQAAEVFIVPSETPIEIENQSRQDIISIAPIPAPLEINVDDFTLEGTNWTFKNDSRAFIQFLSSEEIAGFTGCNNFYANYRFNGSSIDIKFLAMTFDACDDVKDGEFQAALESITTFQFSSPGELTLLDQDDYVVLSLRRGFNSSP